MNLAEDLSVRKEITVAVPPARAFDTFVAMGVWWLKQHSILDVPQADVTIEPRPGGRWYESAADGSTCDWGRVLDFDPPRHLLLQWSLDAEFRYDPALKTEVEVTFRPTDEGTRVTLIHRRLQAYGDRAEAMRQSFGGESGWAALLDAFAATL